MGERLPTWVIDTKRSELVSKNGGSPFELSHVPESGLIVSPNILYIKSDRSLVLHPGISDKKSELIKRRIQLINDRHAKSMKDWEDSGSIGEPPQKAEFFDNRLARVDVSEATIDQEESSMLIPLGECTYFDYVVTRDNSDLLSKDSLALPLGVCGVLIGRIPDYGNYLVYTARKKVDAYSEYLHVVGGMLSYTDSKSSNLPNPTSLVIQELHEEAGVNENEVQVLGSCGLVVDTHYYHPELTYLSVLNVPLNTIFEMEGTKLLPKRKTDKEVELRAVPWTREHVRGLILGQIVTGGDTDLRPWVPTGLANVLLAGKLSFGNEWYNQVSSEYNLMLSNL
jgi:hypothetical protein